MNHLSRDQKTRHLKRNGKEMARSSAGRLRIHGGDIPDKFALGAGA
jgi:hypothetical protein